MTRTCTDVSAVSAVSRCVSACPGVEVGRVGVEVGFARLQWAGVEVG